MGVCPAVLPCSALCCAQRVAAWLRVSLLGVMIQVDEGDACWFRPTSTRTALREQHTFPLSDYDIA